MSRFTAEDGLAPVMTSKTNVHTDVKPINSSVKRTFKNSHLCKEMKKFLTLAEAMRMKNIRYLDLIPGVAHMTLEYVDDTIGWDGVLHIGDQMQIRSQDQYEKYHALIPRALDPWTFEEIQQIAQEKASDLLSPMRKK